MGLSAMVIAGLFSQQVQMQRFIVKKMDLAEVRRVATEVMTNPQACLCNFQGVNVNPNAEFTNLNQMRAQFVDIGAGPDCSTGEVLTRANSALVESIRMENFRPVGPDRYSFHLVFYPQNDLGHVSLQPVRIRDLGVQLSGATVQDCGSADRIARLGASSGPTLFSPEIQIPASGAGNVETLELGLVSEISACFLAETRMTAARNRWTTYGCRVFIDGDSWFLEAYAQISSGGGHGVRCQAICLQ